MLPARIVLLVLLTSTHSCTPLVHSSGNGQMKTVVKGTNGFSIDENDVSNGSTVKWTHFLIKWTPFERQVDVRLTPENTVGK